jgi:PAS domain S-box-containing protein
LLNRELGFRQKAEQEAREAFLREAAYRQEEQRFRAFIDAVKDYAIYTLGTDGAVSSWNEGARRLKGYDAKEITGKHFSTFYSEADKQAGKPEQELEIATREGRAEEEGWRVRKDGTRFWANAVITAIHDKAGKLIGFSKVTRDVTYQKQAEEDLRRANAELLAEVTERKKAEIQLAASEKSLRALSLHLLRSQDEERRRIGRELHDSLGQYVAMLKVNLDSLSLALASNPDAAQLITPCLRLADDALREVRTISYLLYPPMLEEMGLKSAVAWYLEGFTKRSQIQTNFELDPDLGRLQPEVELALFRILQESLTNVHRHSGSSTATVRLFQTDGKVVLEVSDQGRGIPFKLLEESRGAWMGSLGVGLRGMDERVRQLGGGLDVTSTEGGTVVTANVPVGGASTVQTQTA